jgi:hypothetical protein
MRLPRRIALPFGYFIEVRLVSDRKMLEAMDEDDPSEIADGLWDVDRRTIYVRSKLPFSRKVEVLGHEVDHAVNDWRHWLRDTFS